MHHSVVGHPGRERLWSEMQRRYLFADTDQAKNLALKARSQCGVCQACDKKRGPWKCHILSTPIHPFVMDSVAVDLFSMPAVEYEGNTYDTILVCVCQASGYILATPCLDKGLTAEKVCKIMMKHWDIFGIPSVVMSDNGPHFAAA